MCPGALLVVSTVTRRRKNSSVHSKPAKRLIVVFSCLQRVASACICVGDFHDLQSKQSFTRGRFTEVHTCMRLCFLVPRPKQESNPRNPQKLISSGKMDHGRHCAS